MFSKVFNFLRNSCIAICNLELLIDLVLLSGIYYFVFYNFNVKYSLNNDILNELIILFSTVLISSLFINKNENDKKFNDALKSIVLMPVFLIVAFLFYKDNTVLFYAYFTTILIGYFFILKPIVRFVYNLKANIKSSYENCNIDVVLEDNFSKIQKEVLDILNRQYRIKHIVNLSDFDLSKYHIKTFNNLEDFEKSFKSIKNFFFKNSVRKVIYVAGAPNQDRIKKILNFSVKYNFQFMRTNYLENLANIDLDEKITLIPFSFKDFETQLMVNVSNKHFLINFFRNKNVWISYNGEDIILELIRQIAKSGVGMLNVFVGSEQYASQINLLLQSFNALPFANHFEKMHELLGSNQIDAPDYIFYPMEINDPCFSLDNFFAILDKNFFEVQKLKAMADKYNISGLFLISDISNLKCTNWVNVTQRLGELAVKVSDSMLKSYVIRIPKSKISIATLDDFLISEISTTGKITIPESFKSNYLTSTLFNLFVNAIRLATLNSKNIIHVNPKDNEESLLELVETLLNIKGLQIGTNINYFDDITNKKEINEFSPMHEKIIEIENGVFGLEKFVGKTKSEINALEEDLKYLIKDNAIPEVINKCVSIARGNIKK